VIRFLVNQYRLSRRVGFTGPKAIRRALRAYHYGF